MSESSTTDTKRTIIFVDSEMSWESDSLFDYLYEYENVPNKYKEFFYRNDIVNVIKEISNHLKSETKTIYPDIENVFKAFNTKDPKVLILGMDPYADGNAVGLCFSLPQDTKYINPSFRSIQKEIENCGFK